MPKATPKGALSYLFCDDWFIYAKDEAGKIFYVNTESWTAWLECPDGADAEKGAVEHYMLPLARERWASLNWKPAPVDADEFGAAVGEGRPATVVDDRSLLEAKLKEVETRLENLSKAPLTRDEYELSRRVREERTLKNLRMAIAQRLGESR